MARQKQPDLPAAILVMRLPRFFWVYFYKAFLAGKKVQTAAGNKQFFI